MAEENILILSLPLQFSISLHCYIYICRSSSYAAKCIGHKVSAAQTEWVQQSVSQWEQLF